MDNKYKNFSDEEINDLLQNILEEKWYKHEELVKEGLQRYIKLFMKKDKEEVKNGNKKTA